MNEAACPSGVAPPSNADPAEFRNAMRRLAGACTIIATSDGTRLAGLTATAVCSLTADPPTLLVCVNRTTFAHQLIKTSQRLSVNVLSATQDELARRFAGLVPSAVGQQRFEEGVWDESPTGLPILTGALARFECVVSQQLEASTHTIFVSEVQGLSLGETDPDPLIYVGGQFCQTALLERT